MKRKQFAALTLTFLLVVACAQPVREQIRIVGSSTVYPFSASVAEKFGREGKFKTPVVESTGTGGGFKLFCEGIGPNRPDISDASRRILPEERSNCAHNGVHILEIPIGYDGIVFANKRNAPRFALTRKALFLALARLVPVDGKLVQNPYQRWKQIDPALPDLPIEVYGTPPTSGTRDAFTEIVMDGVCMKLAPFAQAYPDEKERKKACGELREDGKYIETGENGNIIVQKLVNNPSAIGVVGFSFLDQNDTAIKAATVEGMPPTFDNIRFGRYPVSRLLYIYVKREHIGIVPGIKPFLEEYTSEDAIGPDGYLVQEGLIPLPDDMRRKVRGEVEGVR
jgi:phosphate transport system substrate-binding protein